MIKPSSNQSKLNNIIIVTNEQKELDLKLAVYVVTHSSIRSMDHLCEILKLIGNNSLLTNLKLHRTKCSSLIKNVLGPSLLEDLVKDCNTGPYSLIVDESTDISVVKYLYLCIKYFSIKDQCIKIEFLGLVEVDSCTADLLFQHLCKYIKNIGLDINQLIGIGTDGASNLCGKNHSLFALLKKNNPNLQIVRCICHSLNNAISKASDQFPSHIDYICREVYNWFHISPLRRAEYKKTFDLINSCPNNKKFHNFHQLSATRWLARSNVVNNIVEHWLELKTHFSLVVKKEKCYVARVLNEMLNDDVNYLYLLIIKPILYEVNHLNITFQKSFVDIGRSYDDISSLFLFLAKKIINVNVISKGFNFMRDQINNNDVYNSSDKCDYGLDYNRVGIKNFKY